MASKLLEACVTNSLDAILYMFMNITIHVYICAHLCAFHTAFHTTPIKRRTKRLIERHMERIECLIKRERPRASYRDPKMLPTRASKSALSKASYREPKIIPTRAWKSAPNIHSVERPTETNIFFQIKPPNLLPPNAFSRACTKRQKTSKSSFKTRPKNAFIRASYREPKMHPNIASKSVPKMYSVDRPTETHNCFQIRVKILPQNFGKRNLQNWGGSTCRGTEIDPTLEPKTSKISMTSPVFRWISGVNFRPPEFRPIHFFRHEFLRL